MWKPPYERSPSDNFCMGIIHNIAIRAPERTSNALGPRSQGKHFQLWTHLAQDTKNQSHEKVESRCCKRRYKTLRRRREEECGQDGDFAALRLSLLRERVVKRENLLRDPCRPFISGERSGIRSQLIGRVHSCTNWGGGTGRNRIRVDHELAGERQRAPAGICSEQGEARPGQAEGRLTGLWLWKESPQSPYLLMGLLLILWWFLGVGGAWRRDQDHKSFQSIGRLIHTKPKLVGS